MTYPDPQYIDVSVFTPTYSDLVSAVTSSSELIEGEDYEMVEGEMIILRDQTAIQREGDNAHIVLRLIAGHGGKLAALQDAGVLQIWGIFPVLGEEGEMESGVYNFDELHQLVIDGAFSDFQKPKFAGS